MCRAVYAIEHADHVFCFYYFRLEEEEEEIARMRRLGILWFERVGVIDSESARVSDEIYAMHCSRLLIPLHNQNNDPSCFLALDLAEKLLATEDAHYGWMSPAEFRSSVFLRFGPESTELVHRPYYRCFCPTLPEIATVSLYIQETMIHPICTLSVDPDDLAWSECDWRECLGSVEANVISYDTLEVSMDDASKLVAICSRPMLMVSQCLPPTYIPKEWLTRAAATVRRCIQ